MWWVMGALAATLGQAFPPPAHAVRVSGGDFGEWLQARPLRPAGTPVHTHDGQVAQREGMRVIDFPLVSGDLQQCADTAIRLRAEWLKEHDGSVSFHATSGDPIPWTRWQGGERPYEVGGRLKWKPGTTGGWDTYLQHVFLWAGTRSLALDTQAVTTPRPGDVVVDPGSPGHAVILLDVARRDDTTFVLVGEGYMPAQDLHVELGPEAGWHRWSSTAGLPDYHWPLPSSGLRRWSEDQGPAQE